MGVLISLLIGCVVAFAAPLLNRAAGSRAGVILALLPLGLTAYFATFVPRIAAEGALRQSIAWVPALNVNLSFYVDGLSVLFALIISGVGFFIVLYGSGYLKGHRDLGRFYLAVTLFMVSMLGVVLADNIITLFVFWELTSFTSYLLIGFNHEQERARKAALQALLVTGTGGLALLGGLILMAFVGGSYEISELLNQGEVLREHGLYTAILILVLAGCFTKSAQFPFHFWLPAAMEAPTPVSAYLHSATMVKAGVYLMARLHPALGGTDLWILLLAGFGAATMVIGSWLALCHSDLKRILAYTTVMGLGTLTMLLGIGQTEYAVVAVAVFTLAHSLYKGALFMVAGSIDHEAGTRDVGEVGGLRKAMPITAAAALVAALSMAGIVPFFGFIAKEFVYEAALAAGSLPRLLLALAILANVAGVAAAGIVALKPFYGPVRTTPKHPHEAPIAMWAGPVVLALLGLLFGLAPGLIAAPLINPVAGAIAGAPVSVELVLWHGFTPVLGMSLMTLALGIGVFFLWNTWRESRFARGFNRAFGVAPENAYFRTIDGMLWIAHWQTRIFQSGYLRHYLTTVIGVTAFAVGFTLLSRHGLVLPGGWSAITFYEWTLAGIMAAGALVAVFARSRVTMVVAIGAVGFSVALIYLANSAPDLSITQIMVETLTVVLFALVLIHLPSLRPVESRASRLRDAAVATALGAAVTLVMLTVLTEPISPHLTEYFGAHSYVTAHGRNIVNVILVDFRALDTLGEIVVLGIAGLGVFALVKLRAKKRRDGGADV